MDWSLLIWVLASVAGWYNRDISVNCPPYTLNIHWVFPAKIIREWLTQCCVCKGIILSRRGWVTLTFDESFPDLCSTHTSETQRCLFRFVYIYVGPLHACHGAHSPQIICDTWKISVSPPDENQDARSARSLFRIVCCLECTSSAPARPWSLDEQFQN